MKASVAVIWISLAFLIATDAGQASPTVPSTEDPLPPIIDCPKDSHLINETCTCNYDYCNPPACDRFLNLVNNSSDIPGQCCPEYSCDECPDHEKIDDVCPCPPETQIGNDGKCECIDPHKSLNKDGVCECDEMKCELPHLCDENSVAIKSIQGCCVNNICKNCPEDSYPVSYKDGEIEDKCACFQCEDPVCGDNQYPALIKQGRNIPGRCCSVYECQNILTNFTCMVNDITYNEGDTWSTSSENCECRNGISFCSANTTKTNTNSNKSCHIPGGVIHEHESKWTQDACTNCTCIDGKVNCIAHMCDVKETKINCPSLSGCKKACEHGYKMKQGCEICKCKLPENRTNTSIIQKCKFEDLELFIAEQNLEEQEVIDIIKQKNKLTTVNKFSALEALMLKNNLKEQDVVEILERNASVSPTVIVLLIIIILLFLLLILTLAWKNLKKCKGVKKFYNYASVKTKNLDSIKETKALYKNNNNNTNNIPT